MRCCATAIGLRVPGLTRDKGGQKSLWRNTVAVLELSRKMRSLFVVEENGGILHPPKILENLFALNKPPLSQDFLRSPAEDGAHHPAELAARDMQLLSNVP